MPSFASTSPHIVVVGSTNTDLVVAVPHIPAPGETILGGALQTVAGGKGANQAVAAARLGARVTFVARVGDDAFGTSAVAGFRREGINTTYIGVTPGVASGVALIPVSEETGENAIVVAPGANSYLTEADVDTAAPAFDSAAAVVVSLEVPLEAVIRTVEMGWTRRIPVILNPAPARSLPPELLTRVTVLTPNETEALQLLGTRESLDPDILAARLLDLGIDAAVMTVGRAGAVIATPDGVETVAGIPVRAVDTVAAGDCFTGALAVEFAAGRSLRDAVSFANAAAALKVTRPGAQPGLPTRDEVTAFVAAQPRLTP
jgi:ribokinase